MKAAEAQSPKAKLAAFTRILLHRFRCLTSNSSFSPSLDAVPSIVAWAVGIETYEQCLQRKSTMHLFCVLANGSSLGWSLFDTHQQFDCGRISCGQGPHGNRVPPQGTGFQLRQNVREFGCRGRSLGPQTLKSSGVPCTVRFPTYVTVERYSGSLACVSGPTRAPCSSFLQDFTVHLEI